MPGKDTNVGIEGCTLRDKKEASGMGKKLKSKLILVAIKG